MHCLTMVAWAIEPAKKTEYKYAEVPQGTQSLPEAASVAAVLIVLLSAPQQ
jgi:hypothetical protein